MGSSYLGSVEPNKDGPGSIFEYLNKPEVRAALHVNPAVVKYEMISDKVFTQFRYGREASLWIYELLYNYGYKMMHIMGDTDGILSLPGAWKWVKKLNLPVTKAWTPWFSQTDGDLVGFVKEYNHFTLVTVHGYGHDAINSRITEVPQLITNFIFNEVIPPT